MAKVKGIDLLIKNLSDQDCPRCYGLKDVGFLDNNTPWHGCVNGNGKHKQECIECFKQAIELEYESEEE